MIRGNHIDGVGLYGEATDVLWGAGVPYGIVVGRDEGGAEQTTQSVLVEGDLVSDCRNGYVRVERASDVTVSRNQFLGPITTAQPAPGSAQAVGSSGEGQMFPPLPPLAGGSSPVFPAVRVRQSHRSLMDNNVVRPAAGERAFLIEGTAVADVVRTRVSDNSIDCGSSPPLGAGGTGEMAVTPAGVVVLQGGNDINGLAIAPTSTPA